MDDSVARLKADLDAAYIDAAVTGDLPDHVKAAWAGTVGLSDYERVAEQAELIYANPSLSDGLSAVALRAARFMHTYQAFGFAIEDRGLRMAVALETGEGGPEPRVSFLPPGGASPEPLDWIIARMCDQVDAERERRTSLDFAYDFEATQALDDAGEEIEAGERLLQMRPGDRANWQALQGAALTAVVSGHGDAVLPMRAEDNWNIQTTATQVLQVLAAMIQHGSTLLFHGGALKSAIRAAGDPATVEIEDGWPE